ncbi:post-transcriptional regulator [Bacillus marasmi]|uniref:post-transcriptional regulator n=1 Tax=Bacillus marasmi TaxID=1926279 RepID=UPI0011C90A01|nr:post-transcriptional regulator [Bacillus marasmi]
MENTHEYERFRELVSPALKSKVSEFQILGYESVSEQEVWDFLINKQWRKVKEDIHLYEIIRDVLGVQVGQYMSYATVEAFRTPEFDLENEEDRKALLR